MSWEFVLVLLPFVILLACPIHMWWMMRHMSNGDSCGKQRNADGSARKLEGAAAGHAEQEIRLLKERIVRLEKEQRHAPELWK